MTAPAIQPGVVLVMAVPMGQTAVPTMETPLNTNWQFTQKLPAAISAPQAFSGRGFPRGR
eukprot:2637390-Prorocentrum_lima.AAC.1